MKNFGEEPRPDTLLFYTNPNNKWESKVGRHIVVDFNSVGFYRLNENGNRDGFCAYYKTGVCDVQEWNAGFKINAIEEVFDI